MVVVDNKACNKADIIKEVCNKVVVVDIIISKVEDIWGNHSSSSRIQLYKKPKKSLNQRGIKLMQIKMVLWINMSSLLLSSWLVIMEDMLFLLFKLLVVFLKNMVMDNRQCSFKPILNS